MRRFKPAYSLYNLFHKKELSHIQAQYLAQGIPKRYFAPVSSLDFKAAQGEPPWLDRLHSKEALPSHPTFQSLPSAIQGQLLSWSDQGYAVLEGFYSEEEVALIRSEVERVKQKKSAHYQAHTGKLMFAIRHSDSLRHTANKPQMQAILNMLLGRKANLFQSINFEEGSQQPTHSDIVHMTTFPLGYLIAIWIALEDIQPGSGVLHYYPGSHKLPYILNPDFDHGGNRFFLGREAYTRYESKIADVVAQNTYPKELFLPKKGDVLIWHANLLHGGEPITTTGSSRHSMVLHYYAEGVACYHEISQRPALMEV